MTECSWRYMTAAAVVMGAVLMLIGFRMYIIRDIWRSKKFRLSLSTVMIAAGMLMCLCAAAYLLSASDECVMSEADRVCTNPSEPPARTEQVAEDGNSDEVQTTHKPALANMVVVPDVVGMEQDEAVDRLTVCGLTFRVWWTEEHHVNSHYRYVASQSVPAGSSVPAGTEILLELVVHR